MNDLFNQFASAFGKKEELSPADAFLAKKNKELEERQQAELDSLETEENELLEELEEVKSAMQPSKAFDDVIPDYSSMPQGLKEAQQRNGIRDHGQYIDIHTANEYEQSIISERFKEQLPKNIEHGFDLAEWIQIFPVSGGWETKDRQPITYSKELEHLFKDENGRYWYNFANYISTGDKVLYRAGIDPSSGDNTSQTAIIKYEDSIATEIIRNPKSTDLNFEKGQADLFEKLNMFPEIPENCISPKDFNSLMLGESGTMSQNPKTDKIYIAIDPGKSGGISAVDTNGNVIFKKEMPLLNDELDAIELSAILSDAMSNYNCVLVVEDVHSIFGVSASNNFVFGWVCGQIDAVVKLSKIKHQYIQPKFWQKNCWTNSDMIYKPLKEGQKRASVDTKATSLITAMRLFPREDLRGHVEIKYYGDTSENRKLNRAGSPIPTKKNKPHDGIVDSLLMAEVARRLNL